MDVKCYRAVTTLIIYPRGLSFRLPSSLNDKPLYTLDATKFLIVQIHNMLMTKMEYSDWQQLTMKSSPPPPFCHVMLHQSVLKFGCINRYIQGGYCPPHLYLLLYHPNVGEGRLSVHYGQIMLRIGRSIIEKEK